MRSRVADCLCTGEAGYEGTGRGNEFMMGTYQFVDLTPKPRPNYVNQWPYPDWRRRIRR